MVLAYNVEAMQAFYSINGQFRSVGQEILSFYEEFEEGSVFHIYLAFVAADRSRQSDSLYLGEIVM